MFVQPRYMTSRMIYHYALPVADLNIAFIGATNVYRPVYRTGVVFNFGIPRERVVKFVNRPIVVKKIVKVTTITNKTVIYKNGKRQGGGINVFAPNLAKGEQPRKDPRRFASSPKEIKIKKTQLRTTLKGDAPKGAGQSAAKVVPISREVGAEGFKPRRNADAARTTTTRATTPKMTISRMKPRVMPRVAAVAATRAKPVKVATRMIAMRIVASRAAARVAAVRATRRPTRMTKTETKRTPTTKVPVLASPI